ncbi:uncharacterized protein [Choristoneura fumiferana]
MCKTRCRSRKGRFKRCRRCDRRYRVRNMCRRSCSRRRSRSRRRRRPGRRCGKPRYMWRCRTRRGAFKRCRACDRRYRIRRRGSSCESHSDGGRSHSSGGSFG